VRWTRRDYGIYPFTPAFDEGTRIRLETLHAAVGWQHQFSEEAGVRITAIHSREHYDTLEADFLSPDLEGFQAQRSQRSELEVDLHWKPNSRLDGLLGYRLLHIHDLRNRVRFEIPGVILLFDSEERLADYTVHDLFAEAGWQIEEHWRLVAGARLTRLPSAYSSVLIDPARGTSTSASLEVEDRLDVNGRVALLWSPVPEQVVKLIWGTASQDSGDASFAEPERIQTVELNSTWSAADWLLSIGLFQNRISKIARTIQRLDGIDYVSGDDNSGRWRAHGLELIVEARPLPRLDLAASLTWQQTEDRRSNIAPGYAPELLAKLRAGWRQGAFTYAAYAHYVAAMEADWDFVRGPVQGEVERIGVRVPAYWNLGLNLRWDPPGAGPFASFNVANLLDEEIRYPAIEVTDTLDRGLIGTGRTVTLSVGYRF
jgi:outer membrane receptor protein involved in Fe transport